MHFSKKPSRIQDQDDFSGVPSSGNIIKFDGTNFFPSSNIGNQGFQGNQGNQGFQGSQGNQGFQGDQGYQGFQGFQGFQGLAFGYSSSTTTISKTLGEKVLQIANIEAFRVGVRARLIDINTPADFLEGKITLTNPKY